MWAAPLCVCAHQIATASHCRNSKLPHEEKQPVVSCVSTAVMMCCLRQVSLIVFRPLTCQLQSEPDVPVHCPSVRVLYQKPPTRNNQCDVTCCADTHANLVTVVLWLCTCFAWDVGRPTCPRQDRRQLWVAFVPGVRAKVLDISPSASCSSFVNDGHTQWTLAHSGKNTCVSQRVLLLLCA